MIFMVIGTFMAGKEGYALARRYGRSRLGFALIVALVFLGSFYGFVFVAEFLERYTSRLTSLKMIVGLVGGGVISYLFLLYLDGILQRSKSNSDDTLDDVII